MAGAADNAETITVTRIIPTVTVPKSGTTTVQSVTVTRTINAIVVVNDEE